MELPAGWIETPLTQFAEVRLGRQRAPRNHHGDSMRPYLRAANVTWQGLDLRDVKEMNFTDAEMKVYRLEPGDILLGEASGSPGEVGKPALWSGELPECAFQNTLLRVRSHTAEPRYLLHYFRYQALSGRFVPESRGVGINHLGRSRLSTWRVPLPPVLEQRRIVEVLEDHLSRLDAADDYLTASGVRARSLEDQSVVSRLIPRSTGTAVAELAAGARPALPTGWAWKALSEVARVGGGVTKDAKKQTDPTFVEVPYLRVANVQRARLDLREVTTIRVRPAQAESLRLQPGDVLMNEGGDRDKLARGWVWSGEIPNCIHQNHVFRARPIVDMVRPEWLAWCANTYGTRWAQRHGRQSVNLASISLSTLKTMPIPVAPLDEQDSALAEIRHLRAALSSTVDGVEVAQHRSAALRRALLAAAFSGRLTGRSSGLDLAEEMALA